MQRRPLSTPSAPAAALLCGALLASLSPGASTSQSSEGVPLSKVVAQSSLIVLATPATPPSRRAELDITPPGEKRSKEKFPPYERVLTRWLVQEVLAGSPKAPPKGATIEVDESQLGTRLEVYRRYVLEKVSKWPIYATYEPGYKVDGAGPRILFLVAGREGALALTADASWESPEKKSEVLALRKQSPPGEILPE